MSVRSPLPRARRARGRPARGPRAAALLPLAALAVLLAPPAPANAQQTPAAEPARAAPGDGPPPDGAALFATHCARCHGPAGAGDGPENAKLERPARSFADGGFSFGDTHEAIRRTLEMGIPGSPMPGFADALTLPQRDALAEHVRRLVPERRRITPDETELVVRDAAELARGHLAPLTPSARAHARGLVLGTPDGLGFVLRADDLALLGVTQGRFVRRSDWTGRGGTPLELLGRTIWTDQGGDPGPRWFVERDGAEQPLTLELEAVELLAERARWSAKLVDPAGVVVGALSCTVGGLVDAPGPGFERFWTVRTREPIVLHRPPPAGALQLRGHAQPAGLPGGPCHGQELLFASMELQLADGTREAWRWSPQNHVTLSLADHADAPLRLHFGERPRDPSCEPLGEQLLREELVLLPSAGAADPARLDAFLHAPERAPSPAPRAAPALRPARATPDAPPPRAPPPRASNAASDGSANDDAAADTADPLAAEARHYRVEHYTPPDGAVLEVGGLAWLADGRLAVATRRGQVWLVEQPLADDVTDARFTLFAEGLHEGLGLAALPDPSAPGGERLLVLQRGELTELADTTGDGRADRFVTVADDWGLSGNYHEFAFGLPRLPDGRLAITLNVSFFSPKWWHGKSPVPWRGWALAVDPASGTVEPLAHGFRSPAGVSVLRDGRLLVTDNQGDWMPVCGVFSVRPGNFHGHPASLDWTDGYRRNRLLASDTQPPEAARTPPALWLPYAWSRSTGNLLEDTSAGGFGPFADQLLVAELTEGQLLRAQLETVDGVEQGASFLLRRGIGSVVRVLQAPDGTLLCGLTNRGWGGLAPDDGLARVRFTGLTPLEIHTLSAREDGFLLRFTAPVSAASAAALTPDDVTLSQFVYDWWWEYGSPERDTTPVPVERAEWNAARTELRLHAPALQPGRMVRLVLPELSTDDGRALLHREASYTLHRMPGRPAPEQPIARRADPPPARGSADEGWLRLSYGDAFDAWEQHGWELVDAEWDPRAPRELQLSPGVDALVNTAPDASAYTSRWALGGGVHHVEFLLTEGAALELDLGAGLRLSLADDAAPDAPAFGTLHDGDTAHAPAIATYRGPGRWHSLDVHLRAARFHADGSLAAPAHVERVLVNDVEIHHDTALQAAAPAPAGYALVPRAGTVALRTLRHRPAERDPPEAERLPLFNGADLGGWRIAPPPADPADPGWEMVDGELEGWGAASLLLSPRDDYVDLEITAEVQVNDGGDGGLLLRADEHGRGYEVQLNASGADRRRTGSVMGLAPVHVELVPPSTWCRLRASVRDEPEGTRLRVWLEELLVVDHLDTERRHAAGHLAVQLGDGLLRLRDLRVREG